ncbi:hypothetical protein BJ170DRAFT_44329 [Xylariales sp. AK1849]|nr:hypothetical protein BJ170DRAFT_44329 [Xylariales sp. AK1849]
MTRSVFCIISFATVLHSRETRMHSKSDNRRTACLTARNGRKQGLGFPPQSPRRIPNTQFTCNLGTWEAYQVLSLPISLSKNHFLLSDPHLLTLDPCAIRPDFRHQTLLLTTTCD